GVGAGVGLRETERAELLAANRRHQPALLLLLGAEAQDRDAAETDVRQQRRREAAVHTADLLDEQTAHDHVAAAAAVLLGIAAAEVAELSELAEEIEREGLGGLELVDARGERLLGEAADGETERLLFIGQTKTEHASSSAGAESIKAVTRLLWQLH